MAQYFLDLVYSLTTCMSCFPSSPNLTINHRSFKILRLLGEGGFSYVYLVQDNAGALYALKKIRCPFGQESVQRAMKEVEAYKLFNHENVIKSIDYTITSDRSASTTLGRSDDGDDGSQKTVYILLPYFRRGNLQDAINANLINHTIFPEGELMRLFLGVCRGLQALHEHRLKRPGEVRAGAGATAGGGSDETTEPLMTPDVLSTQEGGQEGEIRAYAHRDIKPGNVMIDDDGLRPILMDFGSMTPAPTPITSRTLALSVQDNAAEHSTMPYRAPELFDVKTGSVIDEKVDIWSLGCTLYCALYGHSPFELATEESGGSLALAVCSGSYTFPEEGRLGGRKPGQRPVSEGVKEIVRMCLKVEPADRPNIRELIREVERVIETSGDSEE
ncbi:kinase-like domain-containing protein [Tuber brumale]|nr:kinase-like domain-containing protein [Tuber brumale]